MDNDRLEGRIRQRGASEPFKEISVIKPAKGLNILGADINIDDKECSDGTINIEFSEDGVPQKRPGYQNVGNDLSGVAQGIGYYKDESTTYPVVVDTGVFKKLVNNVWTAVSASVSLNTSGSISITSLEGKTFMWDGTHSGVMYDGSTITQPGTMPKAKYSVVYKSYHVAYCVDGQPFRIYISPVNDPARFTRGAAVNTEGKIDLNTVADVPGATVFTGDNSPQAIDINRNDGQKIVGCGFFQDALIIFKESSIYQLYFDSNGNVVVERITSSYGCTSQGSIVAVENDCYFESDNGVFVLGNEPNYYASIRTNELSSRIKPIMQRIPVSQKKDTKAVYFDNRYFLSIPLDQCDDNCYMVLYDRRFFAWSLWDKIDAKDMIIFKDTNGSFHFYFIDSDLPKVREFTWGAYNDDGQPISASFITKAYSGSDLVDVNKVWHVLRPVFRQLNGTVNISYITENGEAGKTYTLGTPSNGGIGLDPIGEFSFGYSMQDKMSAAELGNSSGSNITSVVSAASNIVFETAILLESRTLKIKFTNDKVNENFAILAFKIYCQNRDIENIDGEYVYR